MKQILVFALSAVIALPFTSCQKDEMLPPEPAPIDSVIQRGVYILNSGGMGNNKASLDFYNFTDSSYTLDYYASTNPTVTLGLGDVGNDLGIYGGKMYALITNSNRVEVMEAKTAKTLAHLTVLNPRYLAFYGGKVYVSSFNGAKYGGDPQLGIVAEIDTASYQITKKISVGYQPEGILATDGKLYVANSGGYNINYGTTVSVIDLGSYTKLNDITVGTNPFMLRIDNEGKIWSTSVGDREKIAGDVRIIDPQTDQVIETLNLSISNIAITGDSLYYYTSGNPTVYGIMNTKTYQSISTNFIINPTMIKTPVALGIDPVSKKIFVGDALNFKNSGNVYCVNVDGTLDWKHQSGVIPQVFAFK